MLAQLGETYCRQVLVVLGLNMRHSNGYRCVTTTQRNAVLVERQGGSVALVTGVLVNVQCCSMPLTTLTETPQTCSLNFPTS